MSWGPGYMYYICPDCGRKFKYCLDVITPMGDRFGTCPFCGAAGVYEKDGAIFPDDNDYYEVEE